MSVPADSTTMSGGNNVSDEASRLEQPNDAVAMENMAQSSPPAAPPAGPETTATTTTATTAESTQNKDSSAAAPAPPSSDPTDAAAADTASSKGKDKDTAPPPISKDDRQDSIMAIGPAVDDIKSVSPSGPDSGPVCNITLLLTSGSRHPYKIDAKYLNHRNVNIPEETESGQPDPFSISIYTLKELILREWRSDWEAKPASPSSIRLIHFGKLLDDKEQLKKYQFSTESPNVVHMSIRPQDLDEEEPKSGNKHLGSGSGEGGRQRSGGCCVIL